MTQRLSLARAWKLSVVLGTLRGHSPLHFPMICSYCDGFWDARPETPYNHSRSPCACTYRFGRSDHNTINMNSNEVFEVRGRFRPFPVGIRCNLACFTGYLLADRTRGITLTEQLSVITGMWSSGNFSGAGIKPENNPGI